MRKQITLAIAGMMLLLPAIAQQEQIQSQYVQNHYLLNPAAAGSVDYMPVRGHFRHQWEGIEGHPNTAFLTAHKRFGDHMGGGAMLMYDALGPIARTGINLSYAYALRFNSTDRLAFGLSAAGYYYQLDGTALNFDRDGSTDVVAAQDYTSLKPNFNFGVYASGDKYFAGVSLPGLLKNKIEADSGIIFSQVRHIQALGGYKIRVKGEHILEPSVMMRYVKGAPVQLDFNMMFHAFEKVRTGLSYRSGDALMLLIGATMKEKYHLSYSYDLTVSSLKKYSSGTHEIMLGIDLFQRTEGGEPSH